MNGPLRDCTRLFYICFCKYSSFSTFSEFHNNASFIPKADNASDCELYCKLLVLPYGLVTLWDKNDSGTSQDGLTDTYDDLKKAKMPLRRRNIKLMPISA